MAGKEKALEETILALCRGNNDAVPDSYLQERLPHTSVEERAVAINSLLTQHKLQIFQDAGSDVPKYKAMQHQDSVKLKNLTAEDLLVYQVIQASGNMGIWTRDMKTRTNLAQPKINKILKTLEERNLVKSVKSVQNSSRKVYMLAELEPAKELTGGPWYSDNQNVDEEFISTLRDVARRFISASDGPRSLEEIADWIGKSGVSNQVLETQDVERLLQTLVHDKHIEAYEFDIEDKTDEYGRPIFRKTIKFVDAKVTFANIKTRGGQIPCGTCPVINDCHEGGKVSPETCVYFQQWLDF